MTKHQSFLFIFLLLSFYYSWSQDFVYKHYGLQDGLANPTIHSIFQDKDGFLWIGTESGLCRYDGTHFKTFTVKDGLPNNEVLGLFQDSKGRLWLQFFKNSIAYIYHGKIHSQDNDSVLNRIHLARRVYSIAEDGDGNIVFCDPENVYIISPETELINTIRTIDGKPFNAVGLYVNSHKELIVCTNQSRLYKIQNQQLQLLRTIEDIDNLSQNAILLHPSYIVTGYPPLHNVYLENRSIPIIIPAFSLKYSYVSDSVFSINTVDGLFLYNINKLKFLKLLPGENVTNVLQDMEGNLWIGTYNNGLYKLSSQAIVNRSIGYRKDDICYISKENNKIIVANNSTEVYEYDKNEFTRLFTTDRPSWRLLKVFYHQKINGGSHFMAHAMGLATYHKGVITGDLVTHMLKHVSPVDSNHVLIAIDAGICLVRENDLKIIDTVWHRKSLSSLKTGDSILIGTLNGLFILKEKDGHYFLADSLFNSSIINSIAKSSNDLIWVSTDGDGVYCIKNGKIRHHFTDIAELPSNNTRSIFIQGNDAWLGTDKGLAKITPAGENFDIQKYTTSDGLPSNIINSIYVDGNMVYLGTPEGLCHFDQKLIETTSICNLVLTAVRIGDASVDPANEYSLNRSQRFSIEFSGISFRSEQEMNYRYRIRQVYSDWENTRSNLLEFTSLPYGEYELEIIAINKLGKESEPLIIKLHIKRPFYKTAWFIALIILLPLLLILFLYMRRLNKVRERQMQKLQQEIKMLELEQTALRSQMNPHFIFNCISAMKQLVMENDTANTNKFIVNFASLVRQTFDNAPELYISLNDEIKFLTSYFELEKIRLEDRFNYSIDTTEVKNVESLRVPNMVIQPFVENAIHHGIRYKKDGKGIIEVRFEQQEDLLRCIVTDNGIGREKANQMKKESGIHHKSKGISITFNRIESMNTLTRGKISIAVIDMKDDIQHPVGTKVIIDFYKMNQPNDKNSNHR